MQYKDDAKTLLSSPPFSACVLSDSSNLRTQRQHKFESLRMLWLLIRETLPIAMPSCACVERIESRVCAQKALNERCLSIQLASHSDGANNGPSAHSQSVRCECDGESCGLVCGFVILRLSAHSSMLASLFQLHTCSPNRLSAMILPCDVTTSLRMKVF